MSFSRFAALAALAGALAGPAQAQQFTTAAEVRPILNATRSNWVAVREFDGQDLLYFTHLVAWRCGLDEIYFGVNGEPEMRWVPEPCYDGEAQPNAMKEADFLPFVTYDLGSIQSVSIRIVYDDGEVDSATFARNEIMTP